MKAFIANEFETECWKIYFFPVKRKQYTEQNFPALTEGAHNLAEKENLQSVLSQCNTRLRLLHLLYDIDFTHAKQ